MLIIPGIPINFPAMVFGEPYIFCVAPYRCNDNLAGDEILNSRTFRVAANPVFAILVQAFSFYLFLKIVGDLRFLRGLWLGLQFFALGVNLFQNSVPRLCRL